MKDLIINAIIGKGFFSCEEAQKYENNGYAQFTGNQHNPDWSWNRDKLNTLTVSELMTIYYHDLEEDI